MHHIFINESSLNGNVVRIAKASDSENFNHLVKSLRVNVGEQVLCSVMPFEFSFDYLCEITGVNDDELELTVVEKSEAKELPVSINLYQGISKSDKLEFIIEKAVELGVKSIVPLASKYCIAKIEDKKSDKKLERFNKIAKSAAEQSKRHIIPTVNEAVNFNDMISIFAKESNSYNLLFYENVKGIDGTRDAISDIVKKSKDSADKITINVVIGPEGGFSEKEIEKAKNAGIKILSLGNRILRTETAAVTALSILMYKFTK